MIPRIRADYIEAIAAAEAAWCTGEEPDRLAEPVVGSRPCRRDYERAQAVLDALRSLPVEQRMEAMDMLPITGHGLLAGQRVWIEAVRG